MSSDEFTPSTQVTIHRSSGGYRSDAEPTANPHLVITPVPPPPDDAPDDGRDEDRDDEGPEFQVVHVPTGRHLGVDWLTELDDCRALAAALADLDWSHPDPATYAAGGRLAHYGARVHAAANATWRQAAHQ